MQEGCLGLQTAPAGLRGKEQRESIGLDGTGWDWAGGTRETSRTGVRRYTYAGVQCAKYRWILTISGNQLEAQRAVGDGHVSLLPILLVMRRHAPALAQNYKS